jgi:hypothetical protein
MVDDAGHSAKEPGIRKLLVEVSVRFLQYPTKIRISLTDRLLPSSPVYSLRTDVAWHDCAYSLPEQLGSCRYFV